jgi:hypothetical protein
MRNHFLLALALIALPAAAQVAKTPKLPPANPVPFTPDPAEADVMKPVQALLAALETNDQAAVLAVSRPDGGVTAAFERPDGARHVAHLSWAQFAAGLTPGTDKFEERLPSPAIEIDGDIAMVWGNYLSLTNGKIDHCGVDHFDLVREKGVWKIANATWSQRTTGCEG